MFNTRRHTRTYRKRFNITQQPAQHNFRLSLPLSLTILCARILLSAHFDLWRIDCVDPSRLWWGRRNHLSPVWLLSVGFENNTAVTHHRLLTLIHEAKWHTLIFTTRREFRNNYDNSIHRKIWSSLQKNIPNLAEVNIYFIGMRSAKKDVPEL